MGMTVYAFYWWEWGEQPTLDDIFPTEDDARRVANSTLVQDNIEGVCVAKMRVTEYGMQHVADVYVQEKKPRDV